MVDCLDFANVISIDGCAFAPQSLPFRTNLGCFKQITEKPNPSFPLVRRLEYFLQIML